MKTLFGLSKVQFSAAICLVVGFVCAKQGERGDGVHFLF